MAVGYTGTVAAPRSGLAVNGNVGIGTTNTTAKLEVNGDLKFTGDSRSMMRAPRIIYTPHQIDRCYHPWMWRRMGWYYHNDL